MAQSLFQKARIAVLSNLHGILDKVIDLNSPEALKQYIRDLENAMDDLRAAKQEQQGFVSDYEANIEAAQTAQRTLDGQVDLLLADDKIGANGEVIDTLGNNGSAVELQKQFADKGSYITDQQALLAEAQGNLAQLVDALAKMVARHAEMVRNQQRLSAQVLATKAKEDAAEDLEDSAEAFQAAGEAGASVDGLQAKIQHDSHVADARLQDALAGFAGSTAQEDVANASALQALRERRARLGQAAVASVQDTPASAN